MTPSTKLELLRKELSAESRVLDDACNDKFQTYHSRWTHLNHETPAAIILPTSEEDAQTTVGRAPCSISLC